MGAWCVKCYALPRDEKDKIVLPQKEGDFDLTSGEDMIRNQAARNIYYLMILFRCELCHFRNLRKRDADVRLLRTIRRATFDAF